MKVSRLTLQTTDQRRMPILKRDTFSDAEAAGNFLGVKKMRDYNELCQMMRGQMSTAIQQVNYPTHKGKPNLIHGKFYFVGSVPAVCDGIYYDTESDAILAAQNAGADRIQRADCSFV